MRSKTGLTGWVAEISNRLLAAAGLFSLLLPVLVLNGLIAVTADAEPVKPRTNGARMVRPQIKPAASAGKPAAQPAAQPAKTASIRSKLRYSLWAEVEGKIRIFDSRQEYERFIEFLDKNQFNDIYVQVYRGGRSWFPSSHADQTPYLEAKGLGLDPLGELIAYAHKRGIRVHAWLNALRIESRNSALLKKLGNGIVLIDRQGRSLLRYTEDGIAPDRRFRLDTQGIWLDPSNSQLQQHLVGTVHDLLRAYPEIDGVHLDMIRYPFGQALGRAPLREFGVGYSPDAVRRYYIESRRGRAAGKGLPSGQDWDDWRRLQITILVSQIKEALLREAPDKELSAAVLAAPDRGRQYGLQDWSIWIANGLIDTAVPMSYSANPNIARENALFDIRQRGRGKVILGLGAWLMLTQPNQLMYQTKMAIELGADGVCLFSYANLQNPSGLVNAQAAGELVAGCRTGRCPDLSLMDRLIRLRSGN